MKFLCGSFFLSSLLWFNPSLFRPEYAIVMLGILAGLFQGRSSSICKFKRELWLLAALVAAAVVTVGGQILAGANFIWRDSMVTLMFAYYAGVIIFVGMVSNSNISDRGGWKFGLAVSFLIATISIFQYFNFYHKKKKSLHDYVGNTVVLYSRLHHKLNLSRSQSKS